MSCIFQIYVLISWSRQKVIFLSLPVKIKHFEQSFRLEKVLEASVKEGVYVLFWVKPNLEDNAFNAINNPQPLAYRYTSSFSYQYTKEKPEASETIEFDLRHQEQPASCNNEAEQCQHLDIDRDSTMRNQKLTRTISPRLIKPNSIRQTWNDTAYGMKDVCMQDPK
jgi:hypothetical protein